VADQPTGTVTLVFTDIEGSTRLLRELGRDAYAEALDLHRRFLRDAFGRHGGYEVDSEGDAFFVAFESAGEAVLAAAEAQQALARAEWPGRLAVRVRMGIHTGEPLVVPPKYVGLEIHKAARIMAAGHGGQVLLSEASMRSLDGVETVPLGEHRLKDLLQPEPLFQLRIEGLPSEFPTLKTLGDKPNNLPVQPNPLIGRETEIADVIEMLRNDASRLVTLTGTGGIGKTRLALQVGAEALEQFSSGVFFVALASVTDPELVVPAIAQTLALRPGPGEQLDEMLAAYLEGKQLLLILDNFEQVIDAASVLAELCGHCPELRLLVTSRERLRVASERVYLVSPLEIPEVSNEVLRLEANASVALFSTRARAATGEFALTRGNAEAVAEICRRLDGIPLALELAAARTPALPPRALLARLDQRLQLLTRGARDADERHQTLRRTIEWSHDLLPRAERELFAGFAVFAGGCRLEAAEAVCGDVVDLVSSLVDKNLVQQRFDDDREPRFWMFETLREFALERLSEADRQLLRGRHAQYFVARVHEVVASDLTLAERLGALAADSANIHEALLWARGRGDVATLAAAVGDLWELWLHRGSVQEGRRWAEEALRGRDTLEDEQLVPLLVGAGELFKFSGEEPHARSLLLEALEAERRSGFRSRSKYGTSVAAHLLANLADLAREEGELEQARTYLEESRQLGGGARALLSLGFIFFEQGKLEQARESYEEALVGFAETGNSFNHAVTLGHLGGVAFRCGELETAMDYFRRALREVNMLGDQAAVAECLDDLGRVAARQGDLERAGRLIGAASAFRAPVRRGDQLDGSRLRLPENAVEAGKLLKFDEAVEYALNTRQGRGSPA
jgi:predicted ATPase/class 3 adenylate cyclase